MTQEERWKIRYKDVMEFIEEHDMLNWVKLERKDGNQPCGWFSALMGEEEISPCASLSRDDKEGEG